MAEERVEAKGMKLIEKVRESDKKKKEEIVRIICVFLVAHTYSQCRLDDTPYKESEGVLI